jgi:peptidoglycan/xylan/chitin deacetylase (PgdA/CDA1 family)
MMRLALLLLVACLAAGAWSADLDVSFPRNWTVHVGGTWRIADCPGGERRLEVAQNGQRLLMQTGDLQGVVHGHELSFHASRQALDCLPGARSVHFEGTVDGARISGILRDAEDVSAQRPVTIQLLREFMLSFDDGPLPGATDRVLDLLRGFRADDGTPVRAAFFTVGDAPSGFWQGRTHYAPYEIWVGKGSMRAHPELVERMRREGHVVGNHSGHHAWFHWPRFQDPDAVSAELRAWELALPMAQEIKLFRPPYLVVTDAVRAATRDAGYQLVLGETVGDVAPWAGPDTLEWHALRILETHEAATPTLLIFHDNLPAAHEYLAQVLARLRAKGYRLVHFDARRLGRPAHGTGP